MISGERPAPEQAEADKGFRRRFERRFGKFSRTFTVRSTVRCRCAWLHDRSDGPKTPLMPCCRHSNPGESAVRCHAAVLTTAARMQLYAAPGALMHLSCCHLVASWSRAVLLAFIRLDQTGR